MEHFKDKLKTILEEEFPSGQFEIDETPGSTVGGIFTWAGFNHLEPIDRQMKLRQILRQRLTAEEEQLTSLIIALTPDELGALREE